MEDAIFNMCIHAIHAMHAMNGHWHLTLETYSKKVNQRDAASLNIIAGEYVLFSFTDTGCGFDKETKEKIFDPFFTTKEQLETGLGWSSFMVLCKTVVVLLMLIQKREKGLNLRSISLVFMEHIAIKNRKYKIFLKVT